MTLSCMEKNYQKTEWGSSCIANQGEIESNPLPKTLRTLAKKYVAIAICYHFFVVVNLLQRNSRHVKILRQGNHCNEVD